MKRVNYESLYERNQLTAIHRIISLLLLSIFIPYRHEVYSMKKKQQENEYCLSSCFAFRIKSMFPQSGLKFLFLHYCIPWITMKSFFFNEKRFPNVTIDTDVQ